MLYTIKHIVQSDKHLTNSLKMGKIRKSHLCECLNALPSRNLSTATKATVCSYRTSTLWATSRASSSPYESISLWRINCRIQSIEICWCSQIVLYQISQYIMLPSALQLNYSSPSWSLVLGNSTLIIAYVWYKSEVDSSIEGRWVSPSGRIPSVLWGVKNSCTRLSVRWFPENIIHHVFWRHSTKLPIYHQYKLC